MLGKTLDSKDLETLAEGDRDLDDDIDRLVREGMLEEERESRGDRLTFSSGIVRDVLYAALSRRKRRSLHRKYAELVEKPVTPDGSSASTPSSSTISRRPTSRRRPSSTR